MRHSKEKSEADTLYMLFCVAVLDPTKIMCNPDFKSQMCLMITTETGILFVSLQMVQWMPDTAR